MLIDNSPVRIQRHFNVQTTSFQRYGRSMDVKRTLCAYRVQASEGGSNCWNTKCRNSSTKLHVVQLNRLWQKFVPHAKKSSCVFFRLSHTMFVVYLTAAKFIFFLKRVSPCLVWQRMEPFVWLFIHESHLHFSSNMVLHGNNSSVIF